MAADRAGDGALVVVRAGEAEVETVARLLGDAGRHLATQGFDNWMPPYPVERVRADVAEREVYVVMRARGGAPVATYMLSPRPTHAYEPAPWPDPAGPAVYLNRLAVAPAAQGGGVGAWCLTSIDARARASGAGAVRCDVLASNAATRRFYERHGYVAHGERTHSGWTFACYERRT